MYLRSEIPQNDHVLWEDQEETCEFIKTLRNVMVKGCTSITKSSVVVFLYRRGLRFSFIVGAAVGAHAYGFHVITLELLEARAYFFFFLIYPLHFYP